MAMDEGSSELVRVWLYGPFLVEYRNEDGNWMPVEKTVWDRHPYARSLLHRLLCSRDRRVDRSTLIDDLWPGSAEVESVERYPIDATYQLRKIAGFRALLKTFGAGSGYELAQQSLVWVDVNESEALLREVERIGRTSVDAIPLLERASVLFQRGGFLEGQGGLWCLPKRATTERMRYRCSRWLAEAYEKQGQIGQAEMHYSQLLEDDPGDEDVLCHLFRLLHRQGMTRQALRCYEQTKQRLSQNGYQLSAATEKTIAQLMSQARSSDVFTLSPVQTLESDETVNRREATKHIGMLGLTLFTAPYRLLDIPYFNRSKPSQIYPETLNHFQTLTETCLSLSEGRQLETAEHILWSYLPVVEAAAQQSSEYQRLAANITSQGYLLAASLVGHHNDLEARQQFSEQALLYSNVAHNRNLQIAALRQLAVTFDYASRTDKVLQTYQQALPHINEVSPLLRACVYAALSGVHAQLQQKQEAYRFIGLAYEHFPETYENEPGYLRLINASYNTLVLWDSLNHLELGQPQAAAKIIEQINVFDLETHIPERIRIELLNEQARIFAAAKNLEQACTRLEVAVTASIEIGSKRRFQESLAVYQTIRKQWSGERKVQDLGDIFIQYMINHTQ